MYSFHCNCKLSNLLTYMSCIQICEALFLYSFQFGLSGVFQQFPNLILNRQVDHFFPIRSLFHIPIPNRQVDHCSLIKSLFYIPIPNRQAHYFVLIRSLLHNPIQTRQVDDHILIIYLFFILIQNRQVDYNQINACAQF